ncbi:hypothetical protein [Microbacterium sp. KRD172]|nr:hypothetical protein [Microbacterium sp. KRD172]
MPTDKKTRTDQEQHGPRSKQVNMYIRFAAMILTAMVVMYWVMFVGSLR